MAQAVRWYRKVADKAIEAMPVIRAVHVNTVLELCCVASQPYAAPYTMRADELRYLTIDHLWNDSVTQAAEALANNEPRKSGECAYATIQGPDGRWVRYAGSSIGIEDMGLWIGVLTDKPQHLKESAFDLSITTLDEMLLD